jgi:hypothetical protein
VVSNNRKPAWIGKATKEEAERSLLLWADPPCLADFVKIEERHKTLYLCLCEAAEIQQLGVVPVTEREEPLPVLVCRSVPTTAAIASGPTCSTSYSSSSSP